MLVVLSCWLRCAAWGWARKPIMNKAPPPRLQCAGALGLQASRRWRTRLDQTTRPSSSVSSALRFMSKYILISHPLPLQSGQTAAVVTLEPDIAIKSASLRYCCAHSRCVAARLCAFNHATQMGLRTAW